MSNKHTGLEEPIVVESSGELAGRGLLPVECRGSKSRAGERPSEASPQTDEKETVILSGGASNPWTGRQFTASFVIPIEGARSQRSLSPLSSRPKAL